MCHEGLTDYQKMALDVSSFKSSFHKGFHRDLNLSMSQITG
jgi:hypothetical protein